MDKTLGPGHSEGGQRVRILGRGKCSVRTIIEVMIIPTLPSFTISAMGKEHEFSGKTFVFMIY